LVFLRARAPRLAARKREGERGAMMTKEWREREEGRGRKRESVPRACISLSLALDRRGRTNQEKEKKRAKKKKVDAFLSPFLFLSLRLSHRTNVRVKGFSYHRRLLRGDGADALERSGRKTTARWRRCAENLPSREGSCSSGSRGGGSRSSRPEGGPRGRGFAHQGKRLEGGTPGRTRRGMESGENKCWRR